MSKQVFQRAGTRMWLQCWFADNAPATIFQSMNRYTSGRSNVAAVLPMCGDGLRYTDRSIATTSSMRPRQPPFSRMASSNGTKHLESFRRFSIIPKSIDCCTNGILRRTSSNVYVGSVVQHQRRHHDIAHVQYSSLEDAITFIDTVFDTDHPASQQDAILDESFWNRRRWNKSHSTAPEHTNYHHHHHPGIDSAVTVPTNAMPSCGSAGTPTPPSTKTTTCLLLKHLVHTMDEEIEDEERIHDAFVEARKAEEGGHSTTLERRGGITL